MPPHLYPFMETAWFDMASQRFKVQLTPSVFEITVLTPTSGMQYSCFCLESDGPEIFILRFARCVKLTWIFKRFNEIRSFLWENQWVWPEAVLCYYFIRKPLSLQACKKSFILHWNLQNVNKILYNSYVPHFPYVAHIQTYVLLH